MHTWQGYSEYNIHLNCLQKYFAHKDILLRETPKPCWSVSLWIISFVQFTFEELSIVFSGPNLLLCLLLISGRGLKIDDILKDDEVLTAFLLRDAGLSDSIVHQLVNAEIRLEQVHFRGMTGVHVHFVKQYRGTTLYSGANSIIFIYYNYITLWDIPHFLKKT